MRALIRYYQDIDKEIGQQSNRLHAFLQLSFPLLEKVFSKSSILFVRLCSSSPMQLVFLAGKDTDKNCGLLREIKKATQWKAP